MLMAFGMLKEILEPLFLDDCDQVATARVFIHKSLGFQYIPIPCTYITIML
jgi:hypothetical protein